MEQLKASHQRRVKGQILIFFALCSLVLVGALALALDVGYLLAERRQAQSAADAAALAGGVALLHGESHDAVQTAASAYAVDNGVPSPDADGVDVKVDGSNHDGRVEVAVNVPVQRFFIAAVYNGNWSVSARAVAEIHDDNDGEYGLITLKKPGTNFNGTNSITVVGGSAMTNYAVDANPSFSHKFIVDGTIDSAGPIKNANGLWNAPLGMHQNMPPIDDPMANVPPPYKGTLSEREATCTSNCTWQPGWYHDDSVTIDGKVTLAPGIYYFDNFRLSLQNTSARLQGNGVLLYFDEDSSFAPKNGEMYVTAPPTSPYAGGLDGVVFWYANCDKVTSQGNADYYFEGIFYAPCADLEYSGTPVTPVSSGQMIAGSITMGGTGTIWIDYNHLVDTRVYQVFLVE